MRDLLCCGYWASVFSIVIGPLVMACGSEQTQTRETVGDPSDDSSFNQTGVWTAGIGAFSSTLHVRPPGSTYGTGDGSSWQNALSGLPERRIRAARYYFAAGDYFVPERNRIENYIFDDPEEGESFIGLYKATADDHGSDEGWMLDFASGPAELGPLSFVTSRYVIDGQQGVGTGGYGFRVTHRNCARRVAEFVASPIFFPWDSSTMRLLIEHVDISDCGNQVDQSIPSQDAVYAVNPISHFVLRNSYVHDAWRNLLFLQDAFDVRVERVSFARAGVHHEANSIAVRNTRNVVIRQSEFVDSMNCYISLQSTRNVVVSANVLSRTLAGWDDWAAICSEEPAVNTLIAGNTFFGLAGLNTGIRFTSRVERLDVVNNLWAANRSNQIMLNGDHRSNAFWDNQRVDGAQPVDLKPSIDEPTAQFFESSPFVSPEGLDLRLSLPTAPGEILGNPFAAVDFAGNVRGIGGSWNRGAFEYVN